MEFYNPSVTFKGSVSADAAPSSDNHLVRKQDVSGLSYISSIASGSSSYLEVVSGELSIKNLLISDVTVDSTATSLAQWITNNAAAAAALGKVFSAVGGAASTLSGLSTTTEGAIADVAGKIGAFFGNTPGGNP